MNPEGQPQGQPESEPSTSGEGSIESSSGLGQADSQPLDGDAVIDSQLKEIEERKKAKREVVRGSEPVSWKITAEKKTGNPAEDAIVEGRKVWMSKLFEVNHSGEVQGMQAEMVQTVKGYMQEVRGHERGPSPVTTLMLREKPEVRRLASGFLDRLQMGNMTLGELAAQTNQDSIRAARLVGAAFVEAGYDKNGKQKPREGLTESEKRLVDVGQLLGLEAERQLFEVRLQEGKVLPEQAKQAYKKFQKMSQNEAVPDQFKRSAALTTEKIGEKYPATKEQVTTMSIEEAGNEFERSIQDHIDQEGIKVRTPVMSGKNMYEEMVWKPTDPAMARENVTAPGREALAGLSEHTVFQLKSELEHVADVPVDRLHTFVDSLPAQLEYATSLTYRPQGVVDGMFSWIKKKADRFRAYGKVFGFGKAILRSLAPGLMDEELAVVRDAVGDGAIKVGKRDRSLSGATLYHYGRALQEANKVVMNVLSKDRLKAKEAYNMMQSRIAKERSRTESQLAKRTEQKLQKGLLELIPGSDAISDTISGSGEISKDSEDDFIPGSDAGLRSATLEQATEIKEFINEPPIFTAAREWMEKNTSRAFEDWKIEYKGRYKLLKKEAQERDMSPEDVWIALGGRVRNQGKRGSDGKKAA